jgi:hypothetical protein
MNHSLNAQSDSIFETIFYAQRDAYLKDFANLSMKCEGAKEPLLAMDNASEEELYKLYRPDCLYKDEKDEFSISDFNSNYFFDHDKTEISLNETIIELNPFHWNALKIDIEGNLKNNDQLILWGEKWIDIGDEKEQKNESDFKEVIHSMNIEKHDNKNITIYIDLGTSPTSALIELIDILRTNGVIKVIFKNDGDL